MKDIHSEQPRVERGDNRGNYQSVGFDDNLVKAVVRNLAQKDSSDRTELDEHKNREASTIRKAPYSVRCHFCKTELKTHMCLPKHLKRIHNYSSKAALNAVVKMHYFEAKNRGTRKCMYICSKEGCLAVFHRRDKHSISGHKTYIKPISKVKDLPESVLFFGEPDNTELSKLELQVRSFSAELDFLRIINQWREEKHADFDNGKGARRYADERISNLLKKIKLFVVVTEGFSSAQSVSVYFAKLKVEQNVKAGQTKSQICRELKDFVEFCRLASDPHSNTFALKCDQVERSLNRYQSSVSAELPFRKATAKEVGSRQVASKETVLEVYQKVTEYLYELLDAFENETYTNKERQYKHLQCCLIFILVCRNVCRISTALYIRKEYLQNIRHVKGNLFVFKLIDEHQLKKLNAIKKTGIRSIIDEVTNDLRNTNKNFKSEGVRRVALSEKELFCFIRYLRIKCTLRVAEQSLLFLQLDQKEGEPIRRNVMGKWNRYLECHLKLRVPINTNRWRKTFCTIFAENLEDVQMERSLDRHIGHSRNVARTHYEMIQKEYDACTTSNAVDRVITIKQNDLDIEFAVTIKNSLNEIFEADSASNDQEMRDESDVSEDDECADDDDVDDDESDGSYNEDPASKKRRVIKQKSKSKVCLPFGSEKKFEDGVPSENLVEQFLRSRPQRHEYSTAVYAIVASEFVRRETGKGKRTFVELTKDVKKVQNLKYSTVQFLMKILYEWKDCGYKMF